MLHPKFYIENLTEMGNPHDALADPYRSAHIIIDHVREGDRLAKEERLPRRIRDFIREHHGTMLNTYFYRRAREQRPGQEIEKAAFRYPGPRPRSRETAIVMLADSCEAATRARSPKSRQEVADIVAQIFNDRREERQLDEAPLTLKELSAVREVIIDMLQASYHPRIDYRLGEAGEEQGEAAAPDESVRPDALPAPVADVAAEERAALESEQSRPETSAAASEAIPATPAPALNPATVEEAALPEDEDEAPLAEVPPLRRARAPDDSQTAANGEADN